MSRYCLDTVAYSNFKRGDERITRLIDGAEWIGVPSVVIGELCAGFLRGSRTKQNILELDQFLSSPAVEILPVDRLVATIYAEILFNLRTKGNPIPTNDVWIAATCARSGATLLTRDGHFLHVERIGVAIIADL